MEGIQIKRLYKISSYVKIPLYNFSTRLLTKRNTVRYDLVKNGRIPGCPEVIQEKVLRYTISEASITLVKTGKGR